jgi:hypothetical protein
MGAKGDALLDAFRTERYPLGFPPKVPVRVIAEEFVAWARLFRPEQLEEALQEHLGEIADEAVSQVFSERIRAGEMATRQEVRADGSLETVCVPPKGRKPKGGK